MVVLTLRSTRTREVSRTGVFMANEIVPRWEWRAFGDNFGGTDNPFAGYQSSGTQDSDEIYFLSPASSENVKVRDGLLDIKKFQRANADGRRRRGRKSIEVFVMQRYSLLPSTSGSII